MRYRLPAKYEARDYKNFVSIMTDKLKNDLKRELNKKEQIEQNEVLREAFRFMHSNNDKGNSSYENKNLLSHTLLDSVRAGSIN